jgi:ABC-type branched-subunit amino acid transport system permease subunit
MQPVKLQKFMIFIKLLKINFNAHMFTYYAAVLKTATSSAVHRSLMQVPLGRPHTGMRQNM